MKLLVTGAGGFVGRALSQEMLRRKLVVKGVVRKPDRAPAGVEAVVIGCIDAETDWSDALYEVDVVIHLAARVHVMHDSAIDPLAEFRRVNTAGTEHLAQCAAANGVKRLVYVSSIKVNGEETCDGMRFSGTAEPAPQDSYSVSKWEAEQALHQVAKATGMEVVIVRPPLVYGPGVEGNFARMLGVIARRIPLPFASIHNLRSLIYVGNLVDALIMCATHPAAAGQTYLTGDGEDISTPGLLRQLANGMGIEACLFPCPPALLRLAGKLVGQAQQMERLLGSLQVDGDKMRADLNWVPPYSLQEGLQATAEWYRTEYK